MKTINKLILTGLIISNGAYSSTSKKDIQEDFEQLKYNIGHQNVENVQKNLNSIKERSEGFIFFVTSDDDTLWSNFILVKHLENAERQHRYALRDIEKAYIRNRTNDFIEKTLKPALIKTHQIRHLVAEVMKEMVIKGPSNKAKEKLQQR